MNMVCYEWGLLWMGCVLNGTVMKIPWDAHGLLWTLWTGLEWMWYVMNVVCYACGVLCNGLMSILCFEHGLLWTWDVMKGGLLWTGLMWMCSVINGSVMNVVCYKHGLSWRGVCNEGWYVMNGGLLWTWSVMNVVCYECGLLRMDRLWMWSVMNGSVFMVVSNERVCYERQKWWTKIYHCTIHLKPKKAGQNSNAEFFTEMAVLGVSQSNKQHQKFKQEMQKMQQRQAMERCIKSKKQLSTKKIHAQQQEEDTNKSNKKITSEALLCYQFVW